MTKSSENPTPQMQPGCADLTDRLQLVLDGALTASVLDHDAHAASCPSCRERVAAARFLLNALGASSSPVPPPGLTDSILAGTREDGLARIRRRSFAIAGGAIVAIAASLLLTTWLADRGAQPEASPFVGDPPEVAHGPTAAPEPHTARLSAEFAKVGQTIVDSAMPIAEPVLGAPGLLDWFTGSVSLPGGAPAGFEPTRDALVELPDAARTGLEPVTSTTQKAFARLLRDVGGVQISSRPKS